MATVESVRRRELRGSVDERAFARPRMRLRGALPQPGEESYDESRRIWNGAIDRRPALIAREHDLLISVRRMAAAIRRTARRGVRDV